MSLATAPFVAYINKGATQRLDCAREPGKSYSITYWLCDLKTFHGTSLNLAWFLPLSPEGDCHYA